MQRGTPDVSVKSSGRSRGANPQLSSLSLNNFQNLKNSVDRIPPHLMILLAVVTIQLGAAVSIQLFPVIGAEGAVAVRVIFSALMLALFVRSDPRTLLSTFAGHWRLMLLFGLCLAMMNFFFYKSIERIPLGVAVAIEFAGPLSVSAYTSEKRSHLAWVALAALGIFLLTPLSGADLDWLGIVFAMLSGIGWGMFAILSRRVSARVNDNDGLVIGMSLAAVAMLPFFIPVVPTLVAHPYVLLIGIAVALLSTAIPFLLEFKALKKLSAASYGVLVSTEPAMAVLVGAVLLGERIGLRGLGAVTCIVIAAIAVTISDFRTDKAIATKEKK